MTTGYPFMKLAQRHHVDYGDVLMFAELWKMYQRIGCERPLITMQRNRVTLCGLPDAVQNEIDALMRQPVADRGGPHQLS